MIPDRMRNPLGFNIHAGVSACSGIAKQVWEILGTVVADCRISRCIAIVAAFACPNWGKQTENSSFSFVDKVFADKNWQSQQRQSWKLVSRPFAVWRHLTKEKPIKRLSFGHVESCLAGRLR
jgi:hypothetical protein